MNLSALLPSEITAWLLRYGWFLMEAVVVVGLLVLLIRPLVLWYTGRGEVLERLKRIDETGRKALFELEMLNETLSIPVKRASQKAKAAERDEQTQEPLVVSQETKEGFLQALAKTRQSLKTEQED